MAFPKIRAIALACRSCTVGVTVALLGLAGNAAAINLNQAYEAALKNDPTFREARHEMAAGQEYAVLGRSNLLPSVSASYVNSKNHADITAPDILGRLTLRQPVYHSIQSNISLRQPLINFDATARYRQGLAQTNFTNVQFKGAGEELIVRLVSTYVEALYGDDQVAAARAQRDMYAEQRRVNDRLFAQGEGTRTDMLETQAKLDLAETQLIEALDNAGVTRANLAALIGGDPGVLAPLSVDVTKIESDPKTFDDWRAMAIKNNASIAAQGFAVESAQQEIAKARAGHAPRLEFVASYGKSSSDTINTLGQDTVSRSIGVQLQIPIYSGGAVNATTRQAVANRERALAELDVRKDKVLLELQKDYNLLVSGRSRIAALQKAAESGALLVKATEQSIKGGIRVNLDLLSAQQQQYVTLRDLSQARYNYVLSYLKLRLSAGKLDGSDVKTIATYFQ